MQSIFKSILFSIAFSIPTIAMAVPSSGSQSSQVQANNDQSLLIDNGTDMVVSPNTPGVPNSGGNVPLDGGLSLLLAAGVGYGAKRYKAMQSKKANN
jgi:hypothetical protein